MRGFDRSEHRCQVVFDERKRFIDADVAAELARERRDVGVIDPARHDPAEPAQIRVAVQRESMHRRTTRYPDADCGDFSRRCPAVTGHPYPRTAGDLPGRDTEIRAYRDEGNFQPPHMPDRVNRHRQSHDRVPHQLSGTVPRHPPAAVDVDHRRSVDRTLEILGATTRGEDRRMLQQQAGVGDLVGNPGRVHVALDVPRLLVRDDAEVPERDHTVEDTGSR